MHGMRCFCSHASGAWDGAQGCAANSNASRLEVVDCGLEICTAAYAWLHVRVCFQGPRICSVRQQQPPGGCRLLVVATAPSQDAARCLPALQAEPA
eukprot:239393-Pelagomonas_calceolata.AAC.6